eukprot:scaffold7581_cov122-Isochrysis_galbana.AAC.1
MARGPSYLFGLLCLSSSAWPRGGWQGGGLQVSVRGLGGADEGNQLGQRRAGRASGRRGHLGRAQHVGQHSRVLLRLDVRQNQRVQLRHEPLGGSLDDSALGADRQGQQQAAVVRRQRFDQVRRQRSRRRLDQGVPDRRDRQIAEQRSAFRQERVSRGRVEARHAPDEPPLRARDERAQSLVARNSQSLDQGQPRRCRGEHPAFGVGFCFLVQ